MHDPQFHFPHKKQKQNINIVLTQEIVVVDKKQYVLKNLPFMHIISDLEFWALEAVLIIIFQYFNNVHLRIM